MKTMPDLEKWKQLIEREFLKYPHCYEVHRESFEKWQTELMMCFIYEQGLYGQCLGSQGPLLLNNFSEYSPSLSTELLPPTAFTVMRDS